MAAELAAHARGIRRKISESLSESRTGPLDHLFAACQDILVHDLNEEQFADSFAQTAAYGLFSARCSKKSGKLTAETLTDMIPETSRFLHEMFSVIFSGRQEGTRDADEFGINDTAEMLRDAEIEAVLRDFDDRNPQEDPVIHFYEDFLRQYDARQKIQRGVFYTPRPVVSFIVRSVHELLKKDFGLKDGLADTATWGDMLRQHKNIAVPEHISEDAPFVQMLDPAAGTGTFLVEVTDLIYKTLAEKWEREGKDIKTCWNDYVPKHLLPRLYGFELMMAPYAAAHMKIALKLVETGYEFKMRADEAIRIYLTSSLEPARETFPDYLEEFSPALAHEAYTANEVKRSAAITVVIGNPPYSGHSANKGEWIRSLLRSDLKDGANSYFEIDGERLNERNPKWLNDDYVKFIRYAQYELAKTGAGVLGFITNHSYIDNPTFRGMRQSLMKSFSKIYIADLHGNAKKKEKCADGSKDENVFDIQQGTAVGLFVKKNAPSKISRSDLRGLRKTKYEYLLKADMIWNEINPQPPAYFFMPQETALLKEYEQGKAFPDIFPVHSVGIVTARDSLTIHFSSSELWEAVQDFVNLPAEKAREKYALGKDSKEWKIAFAQKDLKESGPDKNKIVPVLYRPFDIRYTYYTGKSQGFHCRPRPEVMRQMMQDNLGLLTIRRSRSSENWRYALAADKMTAGATSVTSLDINYFFPLYTYAEGIFSDTNTAADRKSNICTAIFSELPKIYQANLPSEKILFYIYAILYSDAYRQRYAEFLKIDFPRIPFTRARDLFEALSGLGSELVSLHLLESEKLDPFITTFPVPGDSAVSKVGETGKKLKNLKDGRGRLYINKTQYFDGIPETVWNFYIGGYQVCHKWLYDRKKAGRRLSDDDIRQYHKIVAALNKTLRIMQEIDQVIDAHGGFPIQ